MKIIGEQYEDTRTEVSQCPCMKVVKPPVTRNRTDSSREIQAPAIPIGFVYGRSFLVYPWATRALFIRIFDIEIIIHSNNRTDELRFWNQLKTFEAVEFNVM
ncbi:hypothetical protein OGAPHI_000569 [Ogataea philodendri]|uniref:Uncharacterized protein n=1 Tax=Ogataea philodendri TaxID=1378263 RepID=A0A9P8TAQ4_9ASCO|nr:uncharacterized protein OGAPHI_000569 [Ogataea philodendri]KAH3671346.1 hypothetical protein OGAPHI_000569 [Ogataea philodendri]